LVTSLHFNLHKLNVKGKLLFLRGQRVVSSVGLVRQLADDMIDIQNIDLILGC
jgi:hypothetical protein